MKTKTPGTSAGVVLVAFCLLGLSAPSRGDDAGAGAAHILEDHLTRKISRKWCSGEAFCLFGLRRTVDLARIFFSAHPKTT